jgi:hypothetical protein
MSSAHLGRLTGVEGYAMGWSYGWKSKEELIRHLLAPEGYNPGTQILASRLPNGGRELWILFQRPNGEKVIAVELLERIGAEWGYKSMSESMGPYYYQVPLEWLGQVPAVNLEWRRQVYAAREALLKKAAAEFSKVMETAKKSHEIEMARRAWEML